jgi:hypothetical protein
MMTEEILRVQASEEWTALLKNVLMTGEILRVLVTCWAPGDWRVRGQVSEEWTVQNYLLRAMTMLRESGILPGISTLTRVVLLEQVEKD